MSHGSDNASSGKWRQNQIAPSTAKRPAKSALMVFYIFAIYFVSVAYSNTKEKLTEKVCANMEIILAS